MMFNKVKDTGIKINFCRQNGNYGIEPTKDTVMQTFDLTPVRFAMFVNDRTKIYGYQMTYMPEDNSAVIHKEGDIYYYHIKN